MGETKIETIAAIDLGANFIRMIIAEISNNGSIKVLDDLHKNTSIGKDTFKNKRIGLEAIYECCDTLNGFIKLMKDYNVKSYWAVSTSGIREAENREYVLEQIRVKTGILIEVINNSQERLLVFKAIRDRLQDSEKIYDEGALVLNIGSGGIEVSVYMEGTLRFTEYIKIGALRLRETLSELENKSSNFPDLMREYVESKIYSSIKYMKRVKIKNFICLGGSLKLIMKFYENKDDNYLTKGLLVDFYNKLCEMSTEKVCDIYNLSSREAKLLLPSITLVLSFINMTEAEGIYVPQISLRHGMLRDMIISKYDSAKKEFYNQDIISSIWFIAEKYGVDKKHANNVEKTAMQIFDQTYKIHSFSERERTILKIAAILHDVGKYISLDDQGKHCYSIIHNEQILGFSDRDLNIVANVARYQSDEIPSLSHENYNVLNYKDKLIVSKLAAVLKLADAINMSNRNKIKDVMVTFDERFVYFNIESYSDITLEAWCFEKNVDFFEEVLGLKPILKIKK